MLIYIMPESLNNFDSFRSNIRTTKLLFDGLSPDGVMFSGNSLSNKKMLLPYDKESEHYKAVTANICNACDTLYDKTIVTKLPPFACLHHTILISDEVLC